MRTLFPLFAAVTLLSACGDGTGPNGTGAVDSLAALPRALSNTEQQAVRSGNDFALRLLRQTNEGASGNVLLSPLSVSLALGMTMNGAAGGTLQEMQQVLGWGSTARADINVAYRDLMAMLPALDPSVTVRLANGIWVRRPLVPDTGFVRDAASFFGAPVLSLATPQLMFDSVNVWGNRVTRGMIPQVLSDQPPPDLVMLLANAVYFAGTWRDRFNATDTRPQGFTLESGATVPVPMMRRKGAFRVANVGSRGAAGALSAVELPYGNSAFSMVLLRGSSGTVSDVVAALDTTVLGQLARGFVPADGESELVLPRFSLRRAHELSRPLIVMGMPRAFSRSAEFPRLFANESTQLGFVQHSVAIDVDEAGTRAAAITVVGVRAVSLPPAYVFDRPFVFLIRDRLSGTVLFAGVVRDPRG